MLLLSNGFDCNACRKRAPPSVSGDGDVVFQTLLHRLKKDGISIAQLMAFGSDGALVMLGHQGGVAGRLLDLTPLLIFTTNL